MGRGQGMQDLGASLPVWRLLLGNTSTQQQFLVISVWVCEDTEVLLSEQILMIRHNVISSIIIFHIRASPSLSYSWMFIPFYQHFPIFPTPQPLATTFFALCFNESDFLKKDSTCKWYVHVCLAVWLISA